MRGWISAFAILSSGLPPAGSYAKRQRFRFLLRLCLAV